MHDHQPVTGRERDHPKDPTLLSVTDQGRRVPCGNHAFVTPNVGRPDFKVRAAP